MEVWFADQKNNDGYLRVGLLGKRYLVHRVIWEMHNGPIPEGMQIDHVNHVRDDNRIENLRVVSSRDNQANMSLSKANKTGFTGVKNDKRGTYVASIGVNGKIKHIGYFFEIEDAINARKMANKKYNYHDNHGE